jgi:hypothetical protein
LITIILNLGSKKGKKEMQYSYMYCVQVHHSFIHFPPKKGFVTNEGIGLAKVIEDYGLLQ